MAWRGTISEHSTAGTLNLDWRCFLNIIKLIGMISTFAQILGKFKKYIMSENLKNFESLQEIKIKIQPCAQPTDLPKTDQVL